MTNRLNPLNVVLAAAFCCLNLAAASVRAAAPVDPELDQLLEAKEAVADQLESYDMEIETETPGRNGPVKSKARMAFDKAQGKMLLEQYTPKGELQARMIFDNGAVYYQAMNGQWVQLPTVPTQLLAAGGVDTDDQADAFAEAAEDKALAKAKRPKLTREERQARRVERRAKRVQRLRTRGKFRRSAKDDLPGQRRKALVQETAGQSGQPEGEALMLIDTQTGQTMETAHFVRTDKLDALHLKRIAKARRRNGGAKGELVEVMRTKVNRMARRNGADVVEESETANQTVDGEIVVKKRMKYRKVNEDLDTSLFERKK